MHHAKGAWRKQAMYIDNVHVGKGGGGGGGQDLYRERCGGGSVIKLE